MSNITSVLDKLGLVGVIRTKIAPFFPKVTVALLQIHLPRHRRREWSSFARAEEFSREEQGRRTFYEVQSRLPVPR